MSLVSDYSSLPDEVLLETFLPQLSIGDLLSLCSTDMRVSELCRNERLWFRKVFTEFPQWTDFKPQDMSYRDYYLTLFQSPNLPVLLQNNQIATIKVPLDLLGPAANLITSILQDSGVALPESYYLTFIGDPDTMLLVQYPERQLVDLSIQHSPIQYVAVTV